MKYVSGFSKLSKEDKINWIATHYFEDAQKARDILELYWNTNLKLQKLHDEFSENTLSNYYLPFGVAPNFLINEEVYAIPMVTEESSVVAAACKAAKFWQDKGGFKAAVTGTVKSGQIHFLYKGAFAVLEGFFKAVKDELIAAVAELTENMKKRGGGLTAIRLVDKTASLEHYYQLDCDFETADAMGANFINSCLEEIAAKLKALSAKNPAFTDYPVEVVMSILSNYVPGCVVRAEVSCPVTQLMEDPEQAALFAEKFVQAVRIAEAEPKRAVTHNKGIMNGIDAVILATGNDFRAVEACAHAYASRNGRYTSLTHAEVKEGVFTFTLKIPLALGTVGGLTGLHPVVRLALEMLQKPSARELMKIVAVVGLAQNFAAVGSLVTTGIQKGHMKMHLMNILNQLEASEEESQKIIEHFEKRAVSYNAVLKEIANLRRKI